MKRAERVGGRSGQPGTEGHKLTCPYIQAGSFHGPCNCRPMPDPLWAIFDLDGCLFDDRHRRHIADLAHAEKDPEVKDLFYQEYHSLCHQDERRIAEGLLLVGWRELRPWHRVAIITGRNHDFMDKTVSLLEHAGLMSCVDSIYMRPKGDRRPSAELKAEIVRHQFLNMGFRIAFALDDDPALIEAYRALNIPVLRSFDP